MTSGEDGRHGYLIKSQVEELGQCRERRGEAEHYQRLESPAGQHDRTGGTLPNDPGHPNSDGPEQSDIHGGDADRVGGSKPEPEQEHQQPQQAWNDAERVPEPQFVDPSQDMM